MTDWSRRIGRHITAEGSVIVPPRIAYWLEQKAGVTADRRISLRDTDPLAYEVLAALRIAALSHCTEKGTKRAAGQPKQQESDEWMTTTEAATELGITERAIRKRIERGRLPARRRGWQWQINRTDLNVQAFAA